MGRNTEKDAVEMASKNRRILENGFRIFSENPIDSVKMTDISDAAGIAISSLYRYYSTKPKLVMAISTWVEIEIIYLDRKDIITERDPNEEIEVR